VRGSELLQDSSDSCFDLIDVMSSRGPFSLVSTIEELLGRKSSGSGPETRAEWTPFQTQYFSENLVAPGIEPGPLDL
jgi:hypothetical protein